tara:strand:+ start:291 stop:392 length:102 start_codon:yes stop_codon:yes gene_type:complete
VERVKEREVEKKKKEQEKQLTLRGSERGVIMVG